MILNTLRARMILNELSHSELHPILEKAIREKFGGGYPVDVYSDRVVFSSSQKYWSVSYSIDKKTDEVTLDNLPVEVRRKVTYLPVSKLTGNANPRGCNQYKPCSTTGASSSKGSKSSKKVAKKTAKKTATKKKQDVKKASVKRKTSSNGSDSKPKTEYETLYDKRKTEIAIAQQSVKKLLPKGATEGKGWSKRGGYAGGKTLAATAKKLTAAGFERSLSDHSSPDGSTVGSGSHYTHPKTGVTVSLYSRLGVTSRDNSYSISVKAPKTKTSEMLDAYRQIEDANRTFEFRKWDKQAEKSLPKTVAIKTRGSDARKWVAQKLKKARSAKQAAEAVLAKHRE